MALSQTSSNNPDINKPLSHVVELPKVTGENLETNVGPEVADNIVARETVADVLNPSDAEKLNTIRQDSLETLAVPTQSVDETTLADIKKRLFPTIDFGKTNPTPEELVNYLLLNHSMKLEDAHDWIAFLASNSVESIQ